MANIPLVTLIDALDTLVVMGNHTEFRRAVSIVCSHYGQDRFNLNVNVSVFETTIRVLGGLLAAHLMATDPLLAIYRVSSVFDRNRIIAFDGYLNDIALQNNL